MNYPYKCTSCNNHWEVIKSVKDIDLPAFCPVCQRVGKRYIARTHFYGAGDWDKAQYCPGLGTVVKSESHRQKIAKSRGLEAVGNEDLNKIETQRQRDRDRQMDNNLEQAAKDAYQGMNKP
jgi:putative FmdB family regulatory protein